MKLNWGTGIAILYISFVGFMIFMVVKASQYDLNLVTQDYYEKDLSFEDHRTKLLNSKKLENNLNFEYSPEEGIVTFQFPEMKGKVEGSILFFRPSDVKQDRSFVIQPDPSNLMVIPTRQMAEGHWRVQVDWSDGVRSYFNEGTLIL